MLVSEKSLQLCQHPSKKIYFKVKSLFLTGTWRAGSRKLRSQLTCSSTTWPTSTAAVERVRDPTFKMITKFDSIIIARTSALISCGRPRGKMTRPILSNNV